MLICADGSLYIICLFLVFSVRCTVVLFMKTSRTIFKIFKNYMIVSTSHTGRVHIHQGSPGTLGTISITNRRKVKISTVAERKKYFQVCEHLL